MSSNVTDVSLNSTKPYRDISCMNERYWPYYVFSIMVTFFGGLLLILIQHGIKYGVAWIRKRKRINQFTNQTDWRVSSGTFTGSNIFLDVPVSNSHLSDVEQSLRGERCGKQCLMIGSKIEIGESIN
ncbi:unnamed protein product [Hymenolepis diminuta]|uniref:NfeD domain-containing protein n=1 Tax=Hymenolepis diminuta TaxID=6216 RepID=A0A0R3SYJ5_HYMDI|nr:unnamed protein product [Hymenolepis diminuta]